MNIQLKQLEEQLKQVLLESEVLRSKLAASLYQITELERMLKLDSSTSSRPPSSDWSKQCRQRSLRSCYKHSGGQRGHKGVTLSQVHNPDIIINHEADKCVHCGACLMHAEVVKISKRQVVDLPRIEPSVTEHRALTKICSCCRGRTTGNFPTNVTAPVQYGPSVQAYSIYLMAQQLLPEDRVQQTLSDLFHISPATHTLSISNRVFADNIADNQAQVLEGIKATSVKHADETGFRIGGSMCWLQVLSTPTATHYRVSERRTDLEPLNGIRGILVHDHWKTYFQLSCGHALCNAHHLRELKALMEIDKEGWAFHMNRLLKAANRMFKPSFVRISVLYDRIVAQGLAYHTSLGSLNARYKKRRPGHNLLLRLQAFKREVLRFIMNPLVPFTNNLAEQDIRMMKVKQKISGGFRTMKGARDFALIRGFISTARKNKCNILDVIQSHLNAATG